MEANYCKTNATDERTPGDRASALELWDGHLTFMWIDFRFE